MSRRPPRVRLALAPVALAAAAVLSSTALAPAPRVAAAPAWVLSSAPRPASGAVPAAPAMVAARPLSPSALGRLRTSIDLALRAAPGAQVSLLAVTDDGQVLAQRTPDKPVLPASTTKLFSIGAALLRLGGDRRLTTTVERTGSAPVTSGVLTGDLVLVAGGDPSLDRPTLMAMAKGVRAAHITKVNGRLLLDASVISTQTAARGWRVGTIGVDTGPLSPLVIDDDLWSRAPGYRTNPSAGNLALFKTDLVKAGVTVTGSSIVRATPVIGRTGVLVTHSSAPLRVLAQKALFVSDNTWAETFLRLLGASAGAGTTGGGLTQVHALASQLGVPMPRLTDGSGLSYSDRVTARQEVAWLAAMSTQPSWGDLEHGLPTACRTGTLTMRLCSGGTGGVVHAKTGTLDHTSALAGETMTADQQHVFFAVIVEGPPSSRGRAAIDAVTSALTSARLGVTALQ